MRYFFNLQPFFKCLTVKLRLALFTKGPHQDMVVCREWKKSGTTLLLCVWAHTVCILRC